MDKAAIAWSVVEGTGGPEDAAGSRQRSASASGSAVPIDVLLLIESGEDDGFMPMPDFSKLIEDAKSIRRQFLRMHFRAQAGHIGSGLSAIDILTYLYSGWLGPKDRFVLSKGHGASSLYAVLNHYGILSEEEIQSYYQEGTLFPAHPAARAHPAIVAATGSLGHGLPIAAGLAYANLLLQNEGRVVCLLSDGECDEGSVWEAALLGAHHHLSNLVTVIDANGLQGFGRTEEVLRLEPLASKWEAFGFAVWDIDGHDFKALDSALCASPGGKPRCIIARTVKGKGVSFLEDKLESHYWPITQAQLEQALAELER